MDTKRKKLTLTDYSQTNNPILPHKIIEASKTKKKMKKKKKRTGEIDEWSLTNDQTTDLISKCARKKSEILKIDRERK